MTWLAIRFGRALMTLLLLVAFVFFTLAASGDPALARFGEDIDAQTLEAFRTKWGLNYRLWKQFLIYLDGLVHFDLGLSFRTGRPAWELIFDRLPATLSLMAPTAVFSIALGCLSAFTRQYTTAAAPTG